MMRNFVLASVLALFLSQGLFAAEVLKVKGKGVLVDLRGDPAAIGDNLFLISPDGKRKAIIRISKVKGDKAIGKILKGGAAPGYTLEFKQQKSAAAKHSPSKSAATTSHTSGDSSSSDTR